LDFSRTASLPHRRKLKNQMDCNYPVGVWAVNLSCFELQ